MKNSIGWFQDVVAASLARVSAAPRARVVFSGLARVALSVSAAGLPLPALAAIVAQTAPPTATQTATQPSTPSANAARATDDDKALIERCQSAAAYSAKFAGRAVLVMHEGKVVFEQYDNGWAAALPHPLASGTKSFCGLAAMFAVQDGILNLDELASDTLTEWKTDPRKSRITVRQLLNLSSGLDPAEETTGTKRTGRLLGPGTNSRMDKIRGARSAADKYEAAIEAKAINEPGARFVYGSSHFYAFGALLDRKLEKSDLPQRNIEEYLHAKLLDPIGLKVARWGKDAAGHLNLPGGCLLTAREWAKLGQFVLDKGAVKKADGAVQHLLKPELLAECFKPSKANPSYGLTWWLPNNRMADAEGQGAGVADGESLQERLRRRALANEADALIGADGQPVTVYMAAGLGKQRLYVLPEQKLVVVRFAEDKDEGKGFTNGGFLGLIVGEAAAKAPREKAAK